MLYFNKSMLEYEMPAHISSLCTDYASEMMDEIELAFLSAVLAQAQYNNDAYVCEIGAYIGNTTVFMAKVLAALNVNVPIVSIDPFDKHVADELNPKGNYNQYINNIYSNNVNNACLPLSCFSKIVLKYCLQTYLF